jgi:hypothetical protein
MQPSQFSPIPSAQAPYYDAFFEREWVGSWTKNTKLFLAILIYSTQPHYAVVGL